MKVTLITSLTVEEVGAICQELETPGSFFLFNNYPLAGISPDGDFWWQTTGGNRVTASTRRDGITRVKINARRHACRERGNVVGEALVLLGLISESGEPTPRGRSARVESYDSLRSDCPWWAVGLDHPAIVEYRRVAEAVGRECPDELIFQDGEIRSGYNEPPVPEWTGLEYRRARANGVTL